MKQQNDSTPANKEIDDNLIEVGKSSSNRFYTNLSTPNVSTSDYSTRDHSVANDTKQWVHNDLNKIKSEEPIFTNENIYMQLIPEAKLELEHRTPSKTEFIQLSNLQPNASQTTTTSTSNNTIWETDQAFADSLNTANSRSFPFRYQNPPKNRKYEPFAANSKQQTANYLDNEAVVNDYQKQKKPLYFPAANNHPNNYAPKHQLDDVRRLQQQPALVHNPNQQQHHYSANLVQPSRDDSNGNSNYLAANYTNRGGNGREFAPTNYKQQPTKLEYEKVRTSLSAHLPATLQDQNNESNRPREYYVKPVNTFYADGPDPPAVQYNQPPTYRKPPSVNSNLVQSEPVYVKEKPIHKKNKIPIYNLDQSQDSYTVKPKPYYNNKPTYPPYEYHFHMPATSGHKPSAGGDYPKNEFAYNRRPLNEPNEYAPPLPSPKPYDTATNSIQTSSTQGRSIGSASTNPELVKPTYLTGFTPVISEHKYSRPAPIEEYRQPIYKSQANGPVQPSIYKENNNGKYNFQLLNSGLISINELDNRIDRDRIASYPNQPYTRASTNKLEQPQYVAPANDGLERINPQFENLVLPENKPYSYPVNKPNHMASANTYAAPSNEDEVMYEKYKSMIRSRLPSKNLVYRPYERIQTSPNYAYNLTGTNHLNNNNINNNYENELTPYNYPKSYHAHNNQLNSHSSNHEPYNNSQPNDYLSYNPNAPKDASPLFFSKYSIPENSPHAPPVLNNKPPIDLEDNDPDL